MSSNETGVPNRDNVSGYLLQPKRNEQTARRDITIARGPTRFHALLKPWRPQVPRAFEKF